MKTGYRSAIRILPVALAALLLIATAGCGGGQQPTGTAQNAPAPTQGEAPAAQPPAAPAQEAAPEKEAAPAETRTAPAPSKAAPAAPAAPPAAAPAAPPAAKPAEPPPAPEPQFIMVKVAEGKNIPISVETALSSKTSAVGDKFSARVSSDIGTKAHPDTVIPAGTQLIGRVTEVQKAKAMSGGARLGFAFDKLVLPSGESYDITATLVKQGESTKSRTTKGVAGGAAGGAILGTILGRSGKSALIGAAAGAAIGTGVVASMDNKDVEIPAGAELVVELDRPLEVRLPVKK